MRIMGKSPGFRAWFYFRTGYTMYFAFIIAAINTLTVTYYLAVEKVPILVEIFPTFLHYVVIFVAIGIPILVATGYSHFKRTSARKAEVDISVETNPYMIRILVNSEYILKLNLKLSNLLLKSQTGQKLSEKETSELLDIQNELGSFLKSRNVSKERDLEFFRKIGQSNIK